MARRRGFWFENIPFRDGGYEVKIICQFSHIETADEFRFAEWQTVMHFVIMSHCFECHIGVPTHLFDSPATMGANRTVDL
jgi:hypothetical protein